MRWNDDPTEPVPEVWEKEYPVMPELEVRTIATLNLNVVAAEEGKLYLLLPEGFRQAGKVYPLPKVVGELARVGALSLPRFGAKGKSLGASAYIKRCREEYGRKVMRRRGAPEEAVVRGVKDRVGDVNKSITEAEAQIAQAVSEFQLKAVEATASLTDLYSLAKSGLEKVMSGYLKGVGEDEEPITTAEFTNAAGKVLSQVAKLGAGLDPEGKVEAEDAVFEEFEKTRERVARSSGKMMPGSDTPN